MAQLINPFLRGQYAAQQANDASSQNDLRAIGILSQLQQQQEAQAQAREMRPLQMEALRGQAQLREAQMIESQRKGAVLQQQHQAGGVLANLLANGGYQGPVAGPSSVAMSDADAIRQVQEAEAQGRQLGVNVPNPGNVQGLAVMADPQRAIPEILKQQRGPAPMTPYQQENLRLQQQRLDQGAGREPLVPVRQADGTSIYAPRSQAAGQQVGGTRGEAPGSNVVLTPDAIDLRASQYLSGDRGATANLGRGRQGAEDIAKITNRAAEILREKGGNPQEIGRRIAEFRANSASLTLLTKSFDSITAFEQTAVRNGEILKELATKVDTTGVPVVERWVRAGRANIAGDEDVAKFMAQLQVYRTEAARILTNPNLTGQLTDSARKEVEEFLKPGASAQQIIGVVDLLKRDFENRRKTLENQINTTRDRIERNIGPSSPESNPGGRASDAQAADWVKRAMDANPGSSLADVITEGKRLKKLPAEYR